MYPDSAVIKHMAMHCDEHEAMGSDKFLKWYRQLSM